MNDNADQPEQADMCLMSWPAFVYIDETEEIVFLSFDYVNKLKSFGSVDQD